MLGRYVSNTTLHLYGSYMYIYIYTHYIYMYPIYSKYMYIYVKICVYIYIHPYTYVHSFSAKGIHDHLWLALGKPITRQMHWVSMPKNHSRVSCFHTSPSIGKHSIYHIIWWSISNDTINIAYLLQYVFMCTHTFICLQPSYTHTSKQHSIDGYRWWWCYSILSGWHMEVS
jgi:hypothetical protein